MTREEKIDMCIDIVEHLVKWCKGYEHCDRYKDYKEEPK